jgi:O-methyltransferase involved in polyketide biosynthesis
LARGNLAVFLLGRKYAIDAAVAEAALRQHRPVVMLTSGIDDMTKLCGERVRLVAV